MLFWLVFDIVQSMAMLGVYNRSHRGFSQLGNSQSRLRSATVHNILQPHYDILASLCAIFHVDTWRCHSCWLVHITICYASLAQIARVRVCIIVWECIALISRFQAAQI